MSALKSQTPLLQEIAPEKSHELELKKQKVEERSVTLQMSGRSCNIHSICGILLNLNIL